MAYTAQQYIQLFAKEHRSQPKLTALLAVLVQPLVDNMNLMATFPDLFSVSKAVGQQQDYVGQLVGITRQVSLPNPVFFSYDTPGLGLDQGIIYSAATATSAQAVLADENYRLLMQAKILDNNWDGSIPDAYAIWAAVAPGSPYQFFLVDHGNMTMTIGFASPTVAIDAVTLGLLLTGELDVKPVGVGINYAYLPDIAGPMFALDIESPYFKGLDEGYFATIVS